MKPVIKLAVVQRYGIVKNDISIRELKKSEENLVSEGRTRYPKFLGERSTPVAPSRLVKPLTHRSRCSPSAQAPSLSSSDEPIMQSLISCSVVSFFCQL
jgi:hypothetical protein